VNSPLVAVFQLWRLVATLRHYKQCSAISYTFNLHIHENKHCIVNSNKFRKTTVQSDLEKDTSFLGVLASFMVRISVMVVID